MYVHMGIACIYKPFKGQMWCKLGQNGMGNVISRIEQVMLPESPWILGRNMAKRKGKVLTKCNVQCPLVEIKQEKGYKILETVQIVQGASHVPLGYARARLLR